MEINIDLSEKPALKLRQPSSWKKNIAKQERYSSTGMLTHHLACNHSKKDLTLQCKILTSNDLQKFSKSFYSIPNKLVQDSFILKHTDYESVVRHRPKNDTRSPRQYSYKYYILKGSTKVQVCKAAFLKVLGVGRARVEGVLSRHIQSGGEMPEERRGGFRNNVESYQNKRQAVIRFIKKFKAIESHYCRTKNSSRIYLSSDLNISKMWKMFSDSHKELDVKHSFFRSIFRTKFNVGFGTPKTDECSTCLQLGSRIKLCSNPLVKKRLQTEKAVHKMKAKAFYSKLKEKKAIY